MAGAKGDGTREETDGRRLRRKRTEEKLITAVGALLRQGGVAALGVNAIAEHAGVEKVLVYRYFGGLDGLMEAYAACSDFWPTLEELIGPNGEVLADPDRTRVGARVLANYARALRKRPITLDLLAFECSNRNPLTIALENVRERRSEELAAALMKAGLPMDGPVAVVGSLFAAAFNYLAVRGRELRVFGGLGVHTDADWERLFAVVELTFRAFEASGLGEARSPPAPERPDPPTRKARPKGRAVRR
jgi:AcrR family transcriptional regulator